MKIVITVLFMSLLLGKNLHSQKNSLDYYDIIITNESTNKDLKIIFYPISFIMNGLFIPNSGYDGEYDLMSQNRMSNSNTFGYYYLNGVSIIDHTQMGTGQSVLIES